ncbi:MAG: cytochrome c3 family protein [Bacillus sp. (in: firmicutes)]
MSKIRLGVSTLFMLILLGIFSAVAFAEDHVPTSTNPAPGINVGDVDNFGNQSTHRTHGNFQNNTNSCANCHSTHNGENEMLLMKSGEYELCMSCHDGTMGFYDVTKSSGAGTFDDSHLSSSMHNVDSDLLVKTAPGAFKNTSTAVLECSSCHNPHGSPNDRLLKEVVVGSTNFASTLVNGVTTPVPVGNKTISLDLQDDPAYAPINDLTGTGGLKITKSNGPKGSTTYGGQNDKIYYSQFCGACHDDYFAKRNVGTSSNPVPGKPSTGTAITATHTHDTYTHTTNSSSQGRSCAACHYAHGTDATVMMDAVGNTVADYTKSVEEGGKGWSQEKAEAYMKDVSARGSSLKKFTNTAVCFACHGTSISTTIDPQYLGADGRLKGRSKIK